MILLVVIVLAASAVGVVVEERRRVRRVELQRHYLCSIIQGGEVGERYLDELFRLSSGRMKQVASEVIASLTPIIYNVDQDQLLRLSYSLHLPEYLLSRASKCHGAERAEAILLLAQLPVRHITEEQLSEFSSDEDRMVRFFTLLARINLDRGGFVRYIAAYPSPLTPFEISGLLALFRRATVMVAYQPLLGSCNPNLNMLGLAVVREFGIESAEEAIRTLLEDGFNEKVRCEALYTLAWLGLSLCRATICGYVKHLPFWERQRFLRFIASRGYSQGVVDLFVSHSERQYFHSLIASYKISLRCT